MPIIDTTINKHIDSELIRLNEEREARHNPSGKLSASMLYQPLRFQVLRSLGAPRKPFDAYTLAKFKRGVDVEDWYVEQLKGAGVLVEDQKIVEDMGLVVTEGQPFAEYNECIGYIDSIIDTDQMQAKKGIIPNEIKSVTNMKMRRVKAAGIDWHYKIQACLYALAMKSEYYAVTIVSAEDLRSQTHIFPTRGMKREVDDAIKAYKQAMQNWEENKVLPVFEPNPNVKWTANLKYAMFEESWVDDSYALKELQKMEK